MNTYSIKPLMLSKVMHEKGPMTYLAYSGQPVLRPYVMWYIRVGDKHLLVDTAIEAEDFKNYHPGFKNMPYESVNSFAEALATVDCEPDDIDIIIQTHLHMDHVYNTPKCMNAVTYVQRKELDFALKAHPIFELLYPKKIIEKLNFQVIEGDETIFPGISVILVPGHTPGCQAVIVETTKGRVVISGFCSIMENFYPPADVRTRISPFATYPVIAPGIHTDLFQAYDSVLRVKDVADIIVPLHDPDMAKRKQIP